MGSSGQRTGWGALERGRLYALLSAYSPPPSFIEDATTSSKLRAEHIFPIRKANARLFTRRRRQTSSSHPCWCKIPTTSSQQPLHAFRRDNKAKNRPHEPLLRDLRHPRRLRRAQPPVHVGEVNDALHAPLPVLLPQAQQADVVGGKVRARERVRQRLGVFECHGSALTGLRRHGVCGVAD